MRGTLYANDLKDIDKHLAQVQAGVAHTHGLGKWRGRAWWNVGRFIRGGMRDKRLCTRSFEGHKGIRQVQH